MNRLNHMKKEAHTTWAAYWMTFLVMGPMTPDETIQKVGRLTQRWFDEYRMWHRIIKCIRKPYKRVE